MDAKKLFARIDELEHEYLQMWIDVCNIESPTNYKPGVDAVGKYFIDRAEKRGWKVEVHKEEISGDALCITLNSDADGQPVCFSGHMDTVHPVGSFGTPAVRVEDGRMYGPGVRDCKGGCVAAFMAMAALDDCGFKARPVKLILQSDEEVGSRTSEKRTVDFMARCAEGCVAFLNAEGYSKDKVCLWRKGISKYEMTVMGQAAHACGCYDSGASAIREAAHKVLELEKFKEKDGITMNCGLISGGTASNVVPETCTLVIDVRYSTMDEMEKAHAFLTQLAETSRFPGTRAELKKPTFRAPMEKTEANFALLERLNEIYEKVGMPVLDSFGSPGGSDASDMTARGIPTIDGFGVRGKQIHSLQEQALIDSLAPAAKRMAAAAVFL